MNVAVIPLIEQMPSPEYDSSELRHLSNVEHARERPSLWLGTDDFSRSASCLARESFCLAIDEILAGRCTELKVTVSPERFALQHNGDCPNATNIGADGKNEIESILTTRWICQQRTNNEYVSNDVCKLSLPTVVFLSRTFEFHTFDGQKHWSIYYDRGESRDGLIAVGSSSKSGISFSFTPDADILGDTKFDNDELKSWFSQLPLPHEAFTVSWENAG